MDREGRVSLTPEALAVSMAAGVDVTVVDAGCGVGGNTIAFARAGARVIAIEQDPGRLDMARHNASLYGVADRVEWIAGDATQLVPTLSADLLFVDPPWGEGYDRGVIGERRDASLDRTYGPPVISPTGAWDPTAIAGVPTPTGRKLEKKKQIILQDLMRRLD